MFYSHAQLARNVNARGEGLEPRLVHISYTEVYGDHSYAAVDMILQWLYSMIQELNWTQKGGEDSTVMQYLVL